MRNRSPFLVLCSVLLVSFMAFAQADLGRIVGTVTDTTGAALSGATVVVVNTETGAKRNSNATAAGDYVVAGLTAGSYKVTVVAPGFAPFSNSLTVSVGGSSTINVKLAVESSNSTVDVAADNISGIQLERGEISQVIDSKQISQLPSLTRNPYDFVQLSGSVSSDSNDTSKRGAGGFNFSGARAASADILLDGAENTDLFGVGVGQTIPLDAVQEYRVIASGFGAEYGRASGGVVNVATKAGTNHFHGTAYEFNRISALAANDYASNALGEPKGIFTRNNFGFSIGGPIFHDKLFIFNNTEWVRVRSLSNATATVPTPELLAASAQNTQAFFGAYGKLQFPINGRVYTVGDIIANKYVQDKPNATRNDEAFKALDPALPAFGTVKYQVPADSGGGSPQNQLNTIGRIDYNLSDKTQLFGRYTFLNQILFPGTNNSSPYAGYNTGLTNYDNNFLLSVTHSFSPVLVSSSKILFTRFNNLQPLATQPVGPTLYINPSNAPQVGSASLNFPGYSQLSPGNAIPFGGPQNFLQIGEDLTLTRGKHSIRFGGYYLYIKDNRVFGAYEEAVDALAPSGTKGGFGNFVNGNLYSLTAAINPQGVYPCSKSTDTGFYTVTPACQLTLPVTSPNFSRSNRYHDAALYGTDTWKATSRLTIDAGLRWEYYGPQHSNHPNLDANFFPASGGTPFDNIRNGKVLTRETSPDHRLWNANFKQFAPRLGFGYDVFGDGKTSLRGSYGISYERNFNNVTFNVIQNPPNYGVVSFITGVDAPSIALSNTNLGEFGGGTGLKALPNVTLRAVDPKIKPSYNQFYTLAIERQVDAHTSVGVSYTGERGIHNYSIANLNRPATGQVYLGDAFATSRLNTQYGSINFRGADGDSYYNGTNLSVKSDNLLHQGITAIMNYTYAHSTDNTSSTFTDGGSNNSNLGYLDPFNHLLDHGNSDFDVRHRVIASLLWDIPYARATKGIENRILDGWEMTTTFSASTGTPFTVFDCTNQAFAVCPRAIFDSKPNYARTHDEVDISGAYGPDTYSYLQVPASTPYSSGSDVNGSGEFPTCTGLQYAGCRWPSNMTARNAFRGPGHWNDDFSAYKSFKIKEGMTLQFRAEFYNVFNHANTYLNVGGTNDVSYSGTDILAYKGSAPGSSDGHRNTQLAAKFVF